MRSKQTLIVQRLTAILLMAVLFFVQGVKLLHRHDYTGTKIHHNASDDPAVHIGHYCAICDYHLTKDAELPSSIGLLQVLSYQYITYSFRPSHSYPGLVSIDANKGPPAMKL
jgi:hypothetical protein